MPFFSGMNGEFGFGRAQYITPLNPIPSGAPAYYTETSGFFMYQPGYNANTLELKSSILISTNTATRTYTGINAGGWTVIHDKDLDSNVYYSMNSGSRALSRIALVKGGTTATISTMYTYSGLTTSVLGACYAPACMWSTSLNATGAFIIAGFSSGAIGVLEFNAQKVVSTTYTVTYTSEVYGTEIIPRAASGFTYDFGVAYTRGSRQMSSWTVDMPARSWTNRTDNSYINGTNGPANGDGMIYYPAGKPIYTNDPDTTFNRIAMNDTSTSVLYVWRITQSGTALVWTFLRTVPMAHTGGYPYQMSHKALSSII